MILLIGCFPSCAGPQPESILFFREEQSLPARRMVSLQLFHIFPGCFPSRAESAALSILFFREKQSIEARRVVALQLLHILPGGFPVHPMADDFKNALKVAGADNVHQFFCGG